MSADTDVHAATVHRALYFCPCGAMWDENGRCPNFPLHVTREARLAYLRNVAVTR